MTGGVNIPTQMPPNWVHRSQKHIVVTTNYRVNIFSYPNAAGLNGSTNFSLQDQRKAVEWVSENIAAFGGDPTKITLWGQVRLNSRIRPEASKSRWESNC